MEEDQNEVFWSLLGDLYTREACFKAEPELCYESQTLVRLSKEPVSDRYM
jgi:hypothetical protein